MSSHCSACSSAACSACPRSSSSGDLPLLVLRRGLFGCNGRKGEFDGRVDGDVAALVGAPEDRAQRQDHVPDAAGREAFGPSSGSACGCVFSVTFSGRLERELVPDIGCPGRPRTVC